MVDSLQLRVIAAFEALEDQAPGPFAPDAGEPGASRSPPGAARITAARPAAAAAWG